MIAPARSAGFEILHLVTTGRFDLPGAIARVRPRLEDERDRALAMTIATGALRQLATLDFIIERLANRGVARLDPEVRDLLRLGLYQLLYMDRVPARAIVNDSVELTKRAGKRSAAPFVNGVLRSLERERDTLRLPEPPDAGALAAGDPAARETALDYLSITLSHPRWLAARWLDRYGLETAAAWMRFNNTVPAFTIRTNTLKTSGDDLVQRLAEHHVIVEAARYAPDGLVVIEGNPLRTPLAGTGLFQVQEEASQLVSLAALVTPGERVLDTCAAPGGKTLALAASAQSQGRIVSADYRERRLRLLRSTLDTAGLTAVPIVRHDLRRGLPFRDAFDCVFVDAPCSGLGTVRRDPEIRWRRTEEDLATLATAQREMLHEAARGVRRGGRLVYATCSSEPEENELVVEAFRDAHPGFELVDLRTRTDLPAPLGELIDEHGYLRTLPHPHSLEAFFAAVLTRR